MERMEKAFQAKVTGSKQVLLSYQLTTDFKQLIKSDKGQFILIKSIDKQEDFYHLNILSTEIDAPNLCTTRIESRLFSSH